MDREGEAKGVNQVKPWTIALHDHLEKLAIEISQVIINTIML